MFKMFNSENFKAAMAEQKNELIVNTIVCVVGLVAMAALESILDKNNEKDSEAPAE